MFEELLVILTISVLAVSLLRKLQLPPILGYLITGILASPHWLGFVQGGGDLEALSEFGVVFLLFMIGLELSVAKLISMRKNLITLGGGQVLITATVIIFIGQFFDFLAVPGAIAIAGALTFSSTAVVTKQLIEQSEFQSRYGQLVLSILLFQDLAAVPFLIIIPSMAAGIGVGDQLYTTLPTGVLVCGSMLIMGRYMLRPLFDMVAEAKSSELFMLATLLVALASAGITDFSGLGKELGAFLAGVMLAETQYAHQIESDIQPFRDVLLGLFFVTVGLRLEPYIVLMHWKLIVCIVAALVVTKTGIVYVLSRYVAGQDKLTSFKSGLALAQGGEFGFAILAIESSSTILPQDILNIITSSILISLALAPLLIRKSEMIAKLFFKNIEKSNHVEIEQIVASHDRKDHVIICGYGRVGQSLALFLQQDDIPFVGIELDPDRLQEAANADEPIFYGDATKEETLLAAGLLYAKLLIITFDDAHKARKLLHKIRFHNPSLPTLVRTKDDRYLTSLQQSGATEIIPETLEASLMIASHMLMILGHDPNKVGKRIAEIKSYRYQMMRSYYRSKNNTDPMAIDEQTFAHAVVIASDAYAFNKTIKQVKEDAFPAKIRSFTRKGIRSFQEPCSDVVLEEGDIVIIEGTRQDIYLSEERILNGALKE
jgi:monovalent cation:H+ antiporter-2, CPA2 family